MCNFPLAEVVEPMEGCVEEALGAGAAVALLFAVAGAAMQAYAPDARSLGQVLEHYRAG